MNYIKIITIFFSSFLLFSPFANAKINCSEVEKNIFKITQIQLNSIDNPDGPTLESLIAEHDKEKANTIILEGLTELKNEYKKNLADAKKFKIERANKANIFRYVIDPIKDFINSPSQRDQLVKEINDTRNLVVMERAINEVLNLNTVNKTESLYQHLKSKCDALSAEKAAKLCNEIDIAEKSGDNHIQKMTDGFFDAFKRVGASNPEQRQKKLNEYKQLLKENMPSLKSLENDLRTARILSKEITSQISCKSRGICPPKDNLNSAVKNYIDSVAKEIKTVNSVSKVPLNKLRLKLETLDKYGNLRLMAQAMKEKDPVIQKRLKDEVELNYKMAQIKEQILNDIKDLKRPKDKSADNIFNEVLTKLGCEGIDTSKYQHRIHPCFHNFLDNSKLEEKLAAAQNKTRELDFQIKKIRENNENLEKLKQILLAQYQDCSKEVYGPILFDVKVCENKTVSFLEEPITHFVSDVHDILSVLDEQKTILKIETPQPIMTTGQGRPPEIMSPEAPIKSGPTRRPEGNPIESGGAPGITLQPDNTIQPPSPAPPPKEKTDRAKRMAEEEEIDQKFRKMNKHFVYDGKQAISKRRSGWEYAAIAGAQSITTNIFPALSSYYWNKAYLPHMVNQGKWFKQQVHWQKQYWEWNQENDPQYWHGYGGNPVGPYGTSYNQFNLSPTQIGSFQYGNPWPYYGNSYPMTSI